MAETRNPRKTTKQNHQDQNHLSQKPPSWAAVRSFFTCKDHHTTAAAAEDCMQENRKKCKRIGCSGSFRSLREQTRAMHTQEPAGSMGGCNSLSRSLKAPLNEINGVGSSSRGMNSRRISGCYECHMVVEPSSAVSRDVSSLRATLHTCLDCGEVFTNSECLELHQAVRHAVSELGPEDSRRNVVQIIFQSSWLKKQPPFCKIDRILKVHNTQKTINRFEDYRNSIKATANKHPRCIADGNELLRFHCTTFVCSIGLSGSTNICNSIPRCKVCSIIRNGFKTNGTVGIWTTATSGRAHDSARIPLEENRATLVCRVIAGRVKKIHDVAEEFDSVVGPTGTCSNLDELFVFNPKAILPCFVVIYRVL
ncbi:uncharacterized protein LOC131237518 [Magnolia sinica]|uniref:uncharacterized protein LOC131237518 n=1 Tax=Magnolia sinica TaxID=86752 RepID=UPI002657D03E|nr:uncharacterized protein LOC131237518 [Magnolia sinica]